MPDQPLTPAECQSPGASSRCRHRSLTLTCTTRKRNSPSAPACRLHGRLTCPPTRCRSASARLLYYRLASLISPRFANAFINVD
ncbi:hypothetical protein Hsc_0874 [Herbaspirillum seropedicae]|nr:hypothetical protein Hsc_0874 [Herbaspirillum seropedicae]